MQRNAFGYSDWHWLFGRATAVSKKYRLSRGGRIRGRGPGAGRKGKPLTSPPQGENTIAKGTVVRIPKEVNASAQESNIQTGLAPQHGKSLGLKRRPFHRHLSINLGVCFATNATHGSELN